MSGYSLSHPRLWVFPLSSKAVGVWCCCPGGGLAVPGELGLGTGLCHPCASPVPALCHTVMEQGTSRAHPKCPFLVLFPWRADEHFY